MNADDLALARQFYASEICFQIRPAQPRLVAAFSSVPRKQFLGAGPWRATNHQSAPDYWTTETGNAREVYHDVAFALDEAQGLNNGPPGLYALLLEPPPSWPRGERPTPRMRVWILYRRHG